MERLIHFLIYQTTGPISTEIITGTTKARAKVGASLVPHRLNLANLMLSG